MDGHGRLSPELAALKDAVAKPAVEKPYAGKTMVIGIGNRYLKDDGIGIEVANEVEGVLGDGVLVCSYQSVDLSLLAQFEGASKVILVDALRSGAPPGAVSKYAIIPSKKPLDSINGLHSLELEDVFDVATQSGLLTCPVTIIGVEPKDVSPGEGLSDELIRAVPRVVSAIIDEIHSQ